MFQQISLNTAQHMAVNQIITEDRIPVYAYGLELLFSSITGVLILVVISLLGNEAVLWIPYLAGFVPVRLAGGGYHAKSHASCITFFSLIYFVMFILTKHIAISTFAEVLICAVNLFILLAFSPVEPVNKPLRLAQRKKNRAKSVLLGATNLSLAVILYCLHYDVPVWISMYFMGSSMAGMSILLAVVINMFRKE